MGSGGGAAGGPTPSPRVGGGLGPEAGACLGAAGCTSQAGARPEDGRIRGLTSALAEMLGAEVPVVPPQYYSIQRRGARVRLRERVPVQLHLWDAHCVDISLSGTLVEHTARVRPGELYRLVFRVAGQPVQLSARAIRSFVNRLVPGSKGEGQIVYRTGMEFVGGETGVTELVAAYIARRRQPGRG